MQSVIVPDNLIFEGGAGEALRVKLLHEGDMHTLLRLPSSILYAQGVNANVLFFAVCTAARSARGPRLGSS